jgi:hypothetical protein
MTEIVAPKPEFFSLAEAAVLVAIGDSDPSEPHRRRNHPPRCRSYQKFQRPGGPYRVIPADILRVKPRWLIEAVAMPVSRPT